jgi:hypothetical protein
VTHEPDFRDLVGEDLPHDERDRLKRVHELVLSAGPPPELPPTLQTPPGEPGGRRDEGVAWLPARRRGRVLALALAATLAALVLGYGFGARSDDFDPKFTVRMQATGAAPGASALIDVGEIDDSGNWPLLVKVRGLPAQREGAYYELYLTRPGKPRLSCGTFRVHAGTTSVRLNAPYEFRRPYGWIVVARGPGSRESGPLLRVHIA